MKLVEIAKGIAVNPEKVIAVKVVDKYERAEASTTTGWEKVGQKIVVVTQEIQGEYSDTASLMYSAEYDSDYGYIDTVERLMGKEWGRVKQ